MKYNRISKAKSRSLEELRDQLRWQQILSEGELCSEEDRHIMDGQCFEKSSENEIEGIKETLPDKNKLLRSYERYADASAKSLVGQAVNAGKEAHEI